MILMILNTHSLCSMEKYGKKYPYSSIWRALPKGSPVNQLFCGERLSLLIFHFVARKFCTKLNSICYTAACSLAMADLSAFIPIIFSRQYHKNFLHMKLNCFIAFWENFFLFLHFCCVSSLESYCWCDFLASCHSLYFDTEMKKITPNRHLYTSCYLEPCKPLLQIRTPYSSKFYSAATSLGPNTIIITKVLSSIKHFPSK